MTLPVVIPAFNAHPMMGEAIGKLILHTVNQPHLIVCDNGSDEDPTVPLQRLAGPRGISLDIIRNPPGTSIYASLNQGLAKTNADYVAIMCTDVFPLFGWDVPCLQLLQYDPTVVWVSPEEKTGPYEWRTGWTALQTGVLPTYQVVTQFQSSIAILNWTTLKEKVGLMDPEYDLAFGDSDYLEQINAAGLQAAWVKGAYAQHLGSQSRRLTGVEKDTSREIADAQRFVAKWKDHPDVLARHKGVEMYLPEHAAQLRAMKAARWEQP